MITNTVCSIIRMNKNGGHDIVNTYPCMWQEADGYEVKKYGEDNADKADIYIPDINADVKKGDYIARGEFPEISGTSGMLVVMSVARHDYGRENMRHVRIGAR
ncbi:MAG: hypothetical protein J1E40_07750 [Oscillospiraceae bacterium]|nr:hypothetical protein [Oscillospiraceae bacterium]